MPTAALMRRSDGSAKQLDMVPYTWRKLRRKWATIVGCSTSSNVKSAQRCCNHRLRCPNQNPAGICKIDWRDGLQKNPKTQPLRARKEKSFRVSETSAEISKYRPFYPRVPGGKKPDHTTTSLGLP